MLTKAQIERAKPGEIVWDDVLKGFGCRAHPSGKRSFVVKYRLPGDRKTIWVTLGCYGTLTVKEAWASARNALKDARIGADPQASKKTRASTAAALTVRDLVRQYCAALKAGTAKTGRSHGRLAVDYVADTVMHLGRFADRYGRSSAAAITRTDVLAVLNEHIEHPSVHRRMHGAINRMFAWARRAELVATNPTSDVVTTRPPARERVLTLYELARVWHAAGELESLYRDLVRLLILTGQRREEVAGMRWGEVQLGAALWVLPPVEGRNKPRRQHSIPLAPHALAILYARHRAFQREPAADDLVLPTISRDGKTIASVSGWNWLKRELDRLSGVQGWRLHDFRRSIVTHCAEHEVDVAVLDSLLNHASSATRGGVIGVYQRATLLKPMRSALELWEKLIAEAVSGGKVVRFPAKR